jgi:hypothetical protein
MEIYIDDAMVQDLAAEMILNDISSNSVHV